MWKLHATICVLFCGHTWPPPPLTVPFHTHRPWQTLKAAPSLCCQASDCAADNEHLLCFSVVLALNPGKHFLRSLIASLRLSIYLSTLLNCALLNACQMKTDGLIYPGVLPWLQESCKSRDPDERWTPKQARGRVRFFQATRCFWVPWESAGLETGQGRVQASLQGASPQLFIPGAISLPTRNRTEEYQLFLICHQGTALSGLCAVIRALFLAYHPVSAVGFLKQKAPLLMAFVMSQWRHKLFMDP